jgi:protein O-mannosyl-transferase
MTSAPLPPWWQRRRVAAAVVVLVAIAAMAPAVANGFTYDDRFIIQDNARVHALGAWWRLFGQSYWPPPSLEALYRPLPMVAYTVQWVAGSGSPWVFHAGNVLVHAALAVTVWGLASRLLPAAPALAAGLLFAVHPVHVEAVANVVGLAELLMATGTVLAVLAYLRWRDSGAGGGRTAAVLAATALAAFSKEQGVLVPLTLLAAELTLVRDARPWAQRVRHVAPLVAGLVGLLVLYVVLRSRAVATWDDAPAGLWMVITPAERRWTMLGVMAEWARLLLWPARLAVEYSPPDIAVYRGWSADLVPGAMVAGGALVLTAASWRRVPVAAFGLVMAMLALAPVSNLLVPTGVVLAERTLLLPSVGVLLALAAWGHALMSGRSLPRRAVGAAVAAVAVLVVLGGVRSALRTRVWRDDLTLLSAALAETPRSYRPWFLLGQLRVRTGNPEAAVAPLTRAVTLFPDDFGALALLGDVHRRSNRCGPAIAVLDRAVQIYPYGAEARAGLVACLIGAGRYEVARTVAAEGERRGMQPAAFRALRRVADSLEALGIPPVTPLP